MDPITTFETPLAAVQSLAGQITGFAPTMYGLAIVAVGITIGIAWIRKGGRAAR